MKHIWQLLGTGLKGGVSLTGDLESTSVEFPPVIAAIGQTQRASKRLYNPFRVPSSRGTLWTEKRGHFSGILQ